RHPCQQHAQQAPYRLTAQLAAELLLVVIRQYEGQPPIRGFAQAVNHRLQRGLVAAALRLAGRCRLYLLPLLLDQLTIPVAVEACQQIRIIRLPVADDLPGHPLGVEGLAPATTTLEPAQRVQRIPLTQPFLGVAVALADQGTQQPGLAGRCQRPAAVALPAPAQPRAPLPVLAAATVLLHREAVPETGLASQRGNQRFMAAGLYPPLQLHQALGRGTDQRGGRILDPAGAAQPAEGAVQQP